MAQRKAGSPLAGTGGSTGSAALGARRAVVELGESRAGLGRSRRV